MPKGKSDIPDLRLERLQKLIESFTSPPNLLLMGLFGSFNAPSDAIKWESITGNRGMTPFSAPGAPSPSTAPSGKASHEAGAAMWKEKMYMDEVFLNNLREPGTDQTYETAQRKLARESLSLRWRSDRRKEWMFAQMLTAGSFTYKNTVGARVAVDYEVPSANIVSLAANRYWDDGSQRNIIEDVMDAKLTVQNAIGAKLDYALITTEILKDMILDKGIQTLVQKSTFGDGDLFARPVTVIKSLLDIDNLIIYDEQYEATAWLAAAVTGASTTTVTVDDSSDFVAGETLRFWDTSAGTYEDETIASVDPDAGTVTVSTAPTASFKSGEDKVVMTAKFLPKTKFCMFASTVEGQKIAEYFAAPYGLSRKWGLNVDTHEEWDPDGVWIRVQDKGLPVLYRRDALYILTVKD